MTRRIIFLALAAIAVFVATSRSQNHSSPAVAYPTGYREWVHVKSALIGPQGPGYEHWGGIHHIYANGKAMEGYRTGHFPEGSAMVFDVLEIHESGGVTTEGARRLIDVMIKDSAHFAETGGWGYEEFRGDSQSDRALDAKGASQCYACHTQAKAHDFVFSTFRK
jgi:hypothetical protein